MRGLVGKVVAVVMTVCRRAKDCLAQKVGAEAHVVWQTDLPGFLGQPCIRGFCSMITRSIPQKHRP